MMHKLWRGACTLQQKGQNKQLRIECWFVTVAQIVTSSLHSLAQWAEWFIYMMNRHLLCLNKWCVVQVPDEQLALFNTMGWIIAWCTNTFYFSKTDVWYVVQVPDEQLALFNTMGWNIAWCTNTFYFSVPPPCGGGTIATFIPFMFLPPAGGTKRTGQVLYPVCGFSVQLI